ncbi:MAG: TIGR03915 family putative DNA repair protein [Polaromonas sp.]|nr:TIGR03915 family putative DNA repair protein [Polaromonas sp.]
MAGRTIELSFQQQPPKEHSMGVMSDPLTNDLFPQALLPVLLRGPVDLEGFRRAARKLLARQILPAQVSWHTGGDAAADCFAIPLDNTALFNDAPTVQVPPEFVALCESVILHSAPSRFDLLYRLLWRLAHEPALRHNPQDADMDQAQRMAQAVQQDMHKMKALMRFRSVQDETFRNHPEGGPLHVAWFEPEHHILEALAPFFARRFAQMRWAILTPQRSAQWDYIGSSDYVAHALSASGLSALSFGPGVSAQDAPAPDADQRLWLRSYQHAFNPSQPRATTAQRQMPRQHRRKLPEPEPFQTPVSAMHQRGSRMQAQPVAHLTRRVPRARAEVSATRPAEQGLLSLGEQDLWTSDINAASADSAYRRV